MVSEQANSIIDKLADKLGIAVERATPLAERVVQEFQNQAIAAAVGYGLITILSVLVVLWAVRNIGRFAKLAQAADTDADVEWIVRAVVAGCLGAIAIIASLFFVAFLITEIRHAAAPTFYCLKLLLQG